MLMRSEDLEYSAESKMQDLEDLDDLERETGEAMTKSYGRHKVDPRGRKVRKPMKPPSSVPPADFLDKPRSLQQLGLNSPPACSAEAKDFALPESTQSRARALARQREIQLKKRKNSMGAMMRGATPTGQFTPGVTQFSAPRTVQNDPYAPFSARRGSDHYANGIAPSMGARREAPIQGGPNQLDFSPAEAKSEQYSQQDDSYVEEEQHDDNAIYRENTHLYERQLHSRAAAPREKKKLWPPPEMSPPKSRQQASVPRRLPSTEDDDEYRRNKQRRRQQRHQDHHREERQNNDEEQAQAEEGTPPRRRKSRQLESDDEKYRQQRDDERKQRKSSRRKEKRDQEEDDDYHPQRSRRKEHYQEEEEEEEYRARRRQSPPQRRMSRDEEEEDDDDEADLDDVFQQEQDHAEEEDEEEREEKDDRYSNVQNLDECAESKEPPAPDFDITALPLHDMRTFLTNPCPRAAGVVQCYIKRNRSGVSKLFPEYYVYMKEGDRFLMCSKKRPNNKTSNYLISMAEHDLKRNSKGHIGKLRANFAGTEFQIYDAGDDHDSRTELGAVIYTSNVLGSRGPRKMQVAVPKIIEQQDAKNSDDTPCMVSDILGKMKAHDYSQLVYTINKPPRWNEQVGAYVLNFNGRVTMASVKNFQLVQPDEQESILLQFGRVGKDEFTMDFQWPMTPFAAFAITLSSFDSKIACD